jgi:hypothetical protein
MRDYRERVSMRLLYALVSATIIFSFLVQVVRGECPTP